MPINLPFSFHQVLTCTCLIAGMNTAAQAADADSFAQLKPLFETPTQDFKPTVRYWLPGAQVDPAVIAKDLHSIAHAGFGSIEVADLPQNAGPVNPARYGWGSAAWRATLKSTLGAAAHNQLRVSLTVGPAWPVVVPGLEPNGPQAAKELVAGWALAPDSGYFDGALPAPGKSRSPVITQQRLVAVQAWKCAARCSESPIRLQAGSEVNVPQDAANPALHWQAPDAGKWIVIAFWERGTGQVASLAVMQKNPAPSDPQAYVPDHFAAAGTQTVIDFWEAHILTPALRALIRHNGRDLFEDSLELDSHLNWTAELPTYFQQHRGYALAPLLPLILVDNQRHFGAPRTRTPTFVLAGTTAHAADVYTDYQITLSDLYRERHLQPLKRWAHTLGLGYRVQTYGMPLDMGASAEIGDTPEGENLTLNNQLDLFRLLATGGHIQGHNQFSTECCSVIGGSYRQSWLDMLAMLQLHYAGGVNQLTLHGYPYSGKVPTAHWPGWSPFEPFGPSVFSPNIDNGFSEAWGPRQPSWPDMPVITRYLARTQALLRHGQAQTELVILNDDLDHEGPLLADNTLAQAGYHYGFISSQQVLNHDLAWQRDQLVMGQAHWHALLVDGSKPISRQVTQRLQALASQGAVVIVVGGNAADTLGHRVGSYHDAVAALRDRHIEPGFVAGVPGIYSVHRRDADTDYYWLVNTGTQVYQANARLRGNGNLARLDTWRGNVVPTPFTQDAPGSVMTAVELQPGQTVAFAIGRSIAKAVPAREVQWQAPTALTDWTIKLADWGPNGDSTRITAQPARNAPQGPWSDVEGWQTRSGRATYHGTFQLAARAMAARLLIPAVSDFWQLTLNGKAVAVDPRARTVLISQFTHPGTNTLELTMASTLNNRMKQEDPAVYGPLPFQAYGLRGAVSVQTGL